MGERGLRGVRGQYGEHEDRGVRGGGEPGTICAAQAVIAETVAERRRVLVVTDL